MKIVFFLGLLCIAALSIQAQRRQLQYQPERVTLKGKIVLRTFFGPPNYGEDPKTDSKEQQWILILDAPIDVIGNRDNETERTVKQITLVVLDFKANPVAPLRGKRVTIEGTLFHANTGHHHTRVLIEVASIKAARRG